MAWREQDGQCVLGRRSLIEAKHGKDRSYAAARVKRIHGIVGIVCGAAAVVWGALLVVLVLQRSRAVRPTGAQLIARSRLLFSTSPICSRRS